MQDNPEGGEHSERRHLKTHITVQCQDDSCGAWLNMRPYQLRLVGLQHTCVVFYCGECNQRSELPVDPELRTDMKAAGVPYQTYDTPILPGDIGVIACAVQMLDLQPHLTLPDMFPAARLSEHDMQRIAQFGAYLTENAHITPQDLLVWSVNDELDKQ